MGASNLASWILTPLLLSVSIPSPLLLCPFLSLSLAAETDSPSNQTPSLAGPGKQTLGLLLLVESCTTAGEEVDSCCLMVDTEAHNLYTQRGRGGGVAADKLLNSKRTKCQRQSVC